jgi:hypothetical protein
VCLSEYSSEYSDKHTNICYKKYTSEYSDKHKQTYVIKNIHQNIHIIYRITADYEVKILSLVSQRVPSSQSLYNLWFFPIHDHRY